MVRQEEGGLGDGMLVAECRARKGGKTREMSARDQHWSRATSTLDGGEMGEHGGRLWTHGGMWTDFFVRRVSPTKE